MKRLAYLVLFAAACGKPAPPPASHPEPLVHRFDNAEKWAKQFDDPARDAWQKPAEIVAAMHIAPGMTVADVGAGTGYFEPYLSRAVGPAGVVLAVDLEPDMVRYLTERAEREKLANVRAVQAEVGDPKLPSHGVDRVLIVDTWHHIPEHAAYLEKLRAALAPGGTITIVELTLESPIGPPPHHRIAPDDLLGELRRATIHAERLDLALRYQYVVVAKP